MTAAALRERERVGRRRPVQDRLGCAPPPLPPSPKPPRLRPLPPLTARPQVVRATLVLLGVLSASLVLQLLVVSPLQQRTAQQRLFDEFRADLAAGTGAIAPPAADGTLGSPVAFLEIPSIGVRQVVVEGTAAGILFGGPGHRRDTVLPGYAGTSVVMARRAAFGGPFSRIDALRTGALIRATTGAGVADYRVAGVRREGDVVPAAVRGGSGRLVLATADGPPFVPSGLLLVDADLVAPPLGVVAPPISSGDLPDPERMMAIDTTTLWRLVLWLQVLLAVALGGVFAWHRWHRAKTWIVFLPAYALVGLMTAAEAARLLPNLL